MQTNHLTVLLAVIPLISLIALLPLIALLWLIAEGRTAPLRRHMQDVPSWSRLYRLSCAGASGGSTR